jgi:Cu-Zn family superoxide dismutase
MTTVMGGKLISSSEAGSPRKAASCSVRGYAPALAIGAVIVIVALGVGLGVGLRGSGGGSSSGGGGGPTQLMATAGAGIGVWTGGNNSIANVTGTVTFVQAIGSPLVNFSFALAGFAPLSTHAFHVHAASSVAAGCGSSPHFDPYHDPSVYGVSHGAPTDAVRHAGDLGNITADAAGFVAVTSSDSIISLDPASPAYIGNLTVVVHASPDGGAAQQPTGNAGARVGCAVLVPMQM